MAAEEVERGKKKGGAMREENDKQRTRETIFFESNGKKNLVEEKTREKHSTVVEQVRNQDFCCYWLLEEDNKAK